MEYLKIKKMKNLTLMLIIILTFYSCGGFKEAGKVLRNEKVTNTDEFLVKKKDPLELPPNFEELPLPNSKKNLEKPDEKIEEILNTSNINVSKEKPTSVEESIIDNIRK